MNNLTKREKEDENYLVFQCLLHEYSPSYLPHMFMCICQNFLIADEILKKEIDVLLGITRHAPTSLPFVTTASHDDSIINEE